MTDRQGKKGFRLNNKILLLTYKTWIDKRELEKFLEEKKDIERIIIAHEHGDKECDYEHTHVAVKFAENITSRNERYLDFNGIHPHIRHLKNNKAFDDAVGYCKKDDILPYTKGIHVTIETRVEKIVECKDIMDAIKSCVELKDVLATIQIWNIGHQKGERHIDYVNKLVNTPFRDYQQEWFDELEKQDDREILWIWDEIGNTGKTWFIKKMIAEYPKDVFLMTSKINDNGCRYEGQKYVFLDLTRTCEEFVAYGAIENMKNAVISSGKYMGRQELYAPAKLAIFANWPPRSEALSRDRWKIWEFSRGTNIKEGSAIRELEEKTVDVAYQMPEGLFRF